ncbi:MAG: PhnD/SsuA/transferrin family substrate-binding protein [Candidatus Methylomirabilia bacterium]
MKHLVALCWLALLAAGLAPAAQAQPTPGAGTPRIFAVVPFYAVEKLYTLYTPFVGYLTTATGTPWELKLYPNHESLINGFCAGEVDVVQLGPVPMARVNKKCGAVPFLAALSPEALPTYRSVIVTADPAVRSLEDLGERPFGLFKGSTAAHILPSKILRDAGLLSSVKPVFFASQDAIINALTTREISGAGIKESLYRRIAGAPFRELKISEPVPNFAFATIPEAAPAIRAAFAEALLRLHPTASEADAAVMKPWDDEIKNGFLLPPAGFLESIVQLSSLTDEIMGAPR